MTDYRCHVYGKYASNDVWSFDWHITSNQSLSTLLTTWSNAWIAAWTNGTYGLQALYATGTIMESFTVYTLDATMGATFKDSLTSAQPGTSSDNNLPSETAILIEKTSPVLTKNGRGFMYLPAPVEGIVVNELYTSTACTRVSTAVGTVRTAINADGSTIFVYPRVATKRGIPAYTKTVITGLRVSDVPSGQTRRKNTPTPTYY
jgi:hypothetical protein